MFLLSELAKYVVVFVVLEIVSLFPLIIWQISKNNFSNTDIRLKRIKTWALRSIFCAILCSILFIFLPDYRTKILILSVVLILFNAALFKTKLF